MTDADDAAELLFFDTFSHEENTDINLDLVQFPKPVYITQVRIIPLGARVQADFPGGVRLGATNPSKFEIDFFVNDLGMPGASTFENLGSLKYNQNDCIHLECTLEKIPTDGLVLRGWYSTITLAVYGILTNLLNEPIASPPPPPCEPVGPEELCNLGSSDSLKEDWKEPLPGEVTTAHKTRASDYEREELEYVGLAERQPAAHYHHHSGDERERDRRLRKLSHSSERSVSSRNRTHSESNERDYSSLRARGEREREKPTRDWSRSPTEYASSSSRHARRRPRSQRSEADESHKWPRTPPSALIVSPARPRSPDNMDYTEEEDDDDDTAVAAGTTTAATAPSGRYKLLKSHAYLHSNESLSTAGVGSSGGAGAGGSGGGSKVEPPLLDDDDTTPGTPGGDQYEPILSDDEIIGDDLDDDSNAATEQNAVDEDELEVEAAALAAGPAIIEFDAFKIPLTKYEADLSGSCNKDLDTLRMLFKKFKMQTKCESIAQFNDVNQTGVDERESFVYLSEQLHNQLSYLSQNYKRRNWVLNQMFASDGDSNTVNADDHNYKQQAFHILRIALDFDAACAQTQPVFKIRHMKVGAKLAELLLGANATLMRYVIEEQRYDPFAAIFALYQQEYMALSIKLMLLKAVYALLDTRIGCQHFISNAKINGYQLLLDLLQQSHLTRTKYALQAIIKKLNLYEALESIHKYCTKLFVQQDGNGDNNKTAGESCAAEGYRIVEQAMAFVLQALAPLKQTLVYQQPKRFLPVSKKFEIINDAAAQRSFANALQLYLGQHALAESLLLLFSNGADMPLALLLRCMDLLQALLHNHVGVDYFMDDCFETTQLLVAVLLGMEEVPRAASPVVVAAAAAATAAAKDEEEDDDVVIVEEPKALATNVDDKKASKEESPAAVDDVKKTAAVAATTVAAAAGNGNGNDAEVATTLENAPTVSAAKDGSAELEKATNSATSSREVSPATSAQPLSPPLLHRLQKLGIELAYKMQTRYHLDAIAGIATSSDYDANALATHLHALYSQTCNATGRQHTLDMLSRNNQLQIFMDVIKKEQRMQTQRQLNSPGAKYKSPALSYAVDMVDCCVRYSEHLDYLVDHGVAILDLAKNHESFEPSVAAVLQEMFVYLKPLEAMTVFPSYDDITPLVDVISRSLEYVTTFPGDMIMSLRMLRHLVMPPKLQHNFETEELKHRYVALQFYAADGMQTLIQILERVCVYFEQPGLHAPALMTTQGLHCAQIVLPALQILRVLLSYAIQCRDVEFKDLTAIDHLMRTYFLLYYYPECNPAAAEVALAKQEIVSILLAYTQPNEQDEESLHKSLWTQMIRELLKNIDAPSTFMPGLRVLAELLPLPLPLPLPAHVKLSESQAQRLVTERKLWSAHLHPQSVQIVKLIETIAPTSFPQLSDMMARVCVQLADLAPNMTLLISKALTDLICNEWLNTSNSVATPLLTRLLHFFARLTTYASLKSSALSILSGRLWDLIQAILMQTTTDNGGSEQTLKCQMAIHRLLENFLDVEISLFASQTNTLRSDLNLASALPPRELIPRIVDAILNNLLKADVGHEVTMFALRNLAILTEHDITFHHLSVALKQKRAEFQQLLSKILTAASNSPNACVQRNVESLIVLLVALTQFEDLTGIDGGGAVNGATRTLKWSANDLALAIGYQPTQTTAEKQPHLLQRLRNAMQQQQQQQQNKSDEQSNEALLGDIDRLIGLLETIENGGSGASAPTADEESASNQPPTGNTEPTLPQAESIVMQYVARPIFMLYDPNTMDEQLRANYWLEPLRMDTLNAEELEIQCERIACNLTELANSMLTTDTNLSSDCKRVLHLSASPQSNRERTPTAPCFRTRRVEVEPSTGRPEKKLYITPVRGRGYSRPPPTRGDPFRSRPPNTSRPPSLHVDDFLALETCGAQPTGPTGYNKIPPLMRGSRVGRNRGSRISAVAAYRKTKVLRTSSPSTWNESGSPLYRSADSHFSGGGGSGSGGGGEPYSSHYAGRPRGRGSRIRSYLR